MPYGAGTYGKQVGRPSNAQKNSGKSSLKDAIVKREIKKNQMPTNMKKA
tara:strand:- start:743 stop:889 length:147 start_codon:yes stop_codon:yes gene_type:complete